jgi:beta-galactosidase
LYKLKYGINDLSNETPPTLNNYIDLLKLPFNQTYQLAVVGVNDAGESAASEVQKVKVESGFLPPLIYYAEGANKGFFVGYTTDKDDYVFRIQYTTKQGDYSNAKTIQTSTKGVLFVPELVNGKTYYFRMSRIKDNNYLTPWSEEHAVTTDGLQRPAPPLVRGVIRSNNEAIVVFEPVKKAVGYVCQYKPKNSSSWKTIKVNAANIQHCKIDGLAANSAYEFRMASENANGESLFSESLSQ